MFYYLLHHSLPETERFCDGRRNCATFLYGSCLYCVTYVVVMNLRLRLGECMDSVRPALFVAWLADCSAVGFLYKSHYGRSLLCEVGEVAGAVDRRPGGGWVFDEATGQYRRPNEADELRRKAEEAEALAAERSRLEAIFAARERTERVAKIDEHKRRVRAAKVIQRWWRNVLYAPPDGLLYRRASERFAVASAVAGAVAASSAS